MFLLISTASKERHGRKNEKLIYRVNRNLEECGIGIVVELMLSCRSSPFDHAYPC